MKLLQNARVLAVFSIVAGLVIPSLCLAQREVNWQLNPKGFPDKASVFVDVTDRVGGKPNFVGTIAPTGFAVSVDEFTGDQGGYIMNQQTLRAGNAGSQVLIMIDRSRSYTGSFAKAKRMAKEIVNHRLMNPGIDQIAVASFPASGYSESRLLMSFTNNKASLNQAIDAISLPPKDDKTGARICNALAEGLTFFPENVTDKYRTVIFLTGGADKGEGKGNCVRDSYAAGKVPFNNLVFKLDRKYDDPRNSHKIENGCHDLAKNTGGRSYFRKTESEMKAFINSFWSRIRAQYHLQVNFPCYKPSPQVQHYSMLKVDGRDTEVIKFQATSMPAPVPEITAIYPQQAYRNQVDDGNIDLTIDGKGFCAMPGRIKAYVGGVPVNVKSYNPFRVVASLNSNTKSGTIKLANYFGQQGESPMKFNIIKPPKGAEASSTLMYLVIGFVVLIVLAVIIVALRSRKAKVPLGPPPTASDVRPSSVSSGGAPKTVAVNATSNAWVQRQDGSKQDLSIGDNILGREDHCAFKLTVQGVSREHAKIFVDPGSGSITVEDLGSTNGTFHGSAETTQALANKLTAKQIVANGDHIWISGEQLTIFIKEG